LVTPSFAERLPVQLRDQRLIEVKQVCLGQQVRPFQHFMQRTTRTV